MRWFRSSARTEIMKDISFSKRGEVLSSTNASSGGNFSHGGGGAQSTGRNGIMIAALLFIFLIVGVFLFGYLGSEKGQRAVQDFWATVMQYTFEPISDLVVSIFAFGSDDYFSPRGNSSSSKKGIDLDDFRSITGETIPEGQSFDILYDIEYNNVPSSKSYQAEFSCYLNVTKRDDEKIDPPESIIGETISPTQGIIQKGTTTYCRIPGEKTEGLDGAYTVYGSFTFKTETLDATLPVYFIPGALADQLDDTKVDFFDYVGLPISQSDLRVTYNGEPISLAIAAGAEGEEEQPVILREGNDGISYTTVGVTLRNEWGGDIARLDSLTLYLPDGITLSDEYNQEPSTACPFVSSGRDGRRNMYTLDDSIREELFTDYTSLGAFFGKSDFHTFQCLTEIEAGFLSENDAYVQKEYEVDAEYHYKVQEQQETISIVGRGDPLVVEGVDLG